VLAVLLTKHMKALPETGAPSASRMALVTMSAYPVCWSNSSSDSTNNVRLAGSQTVWLMPITAAVAAIESVVSAKRTRNTLELSTLAGSMGPLNGIRRRGCRLKPSSVFKTMTSLQSEGRTAQSGCGRLTRNPVRLVLSTTAKRLHGNGVFFGIAASRVV
jgi:hypothetical protein